MWVASESIILTTISLLIGCSLKLAIRDRFGGDREGWASTKTNSVQKELLKKKIKNWKEIEQGLSTIQVNSSISYQPKGEKKLCPRKLPNPPSVQKKIGPLLHFIMLWLEIMTNYVRFKPEWVQVWQRCH